tara:strand:- start:417 stop:611 length:195 start_codon:yes stop_codon:yes gene_type:complete
MISFSLLSYRYLGADIGPPSRYLVITPYIYRGADIVVDMRGVAINNFFLLNILQASQVVSNVVS